MPKGKNNLELRRRVKPTCLKKSHWDKTEGWKLMKRKKTDEGLVQRYFAPLFSLINVFSRAKHTVGASFWGSYTSLFSLQCFFLEPNTRLAQAVGDFTPPYREEREQEGTKSKHERYKGTNRQSKWGVLKIESLLSSCPLGPLYRREVGPSHSCLYIISLIPVPLPHI